MNQDLKRMTLTSSFWKEGFRENLELNAEGYMQLKDRNKMGIFISKSLDFVDRGMTYHRLILECILSENANIQVGVRASDVTYLVYKGKLNEVDEFLADPKVSLEEKQQLFKEKGAVYYSKTTDMLLHSLKGRYLWIYISIFDKSDEPFEMQMISLEFPQLSFVEYLPEIYRTNNEFLKRYLGVFQSIYLDMERQIDRLPMLLDPDIVSGRFLEYLAFWLGIDNEGSILDREQFRYVVKNAVELNRTKGTVRSIKEMVKIYTGEEPYIVEFFQLHKYVGNNEEREKVYKRMYMDNPYTFCVIIKNDEIFEKGRSIEELSRLIEKVKPAHTIAKIVVLKKSIRLDMHSYTGINTVLEKRSAASLDDKSKIDGSFYLDE